MLLGANGQNVYPEEVEDVILSNSLADECVLVQRDQKFVALVYVNDATLERVKLQREQLAYIFESSRAAVNEMLPKFVQITAFEVHEEEFQKTPKKNIKRFLYK
jgi:long-chain acyl-CoA synthetase